MAVRVRRLAWQDIALDIAPLTLGLGSGLTRRPGAAPGDVIAVTDRGPNLFISQALALGHAHLAPMRSIPDAKFMATPQEGPEIVHLRVVGDAVQAGRRLALRTRAGNRLSGVAPAGPAMEKLFTLDGAALLPDPLGVDPEAIAALPDGGFVIAEEYAPSLLKVAADGVVTERWVPAGLEEAVRHPDILIRGVLPAALARRRPNRGLEAVCASPDGRWLYVGLQSAPEGDDPAFAPIWKLDAATGSCVATYRHPFHPPHAFRRDASRRKVTSDDLKICEFAWLGEERLLVLERIAHTTKIYAMDLTSERKALVMSSDDFPEVGPDMEGMTLLTDRDVLLMSDNDFGVDGAKTEAWLVSADQPI